MHDNGREEKTANNEDQRSEGADAPVCAARRERFLLLRVDAEPSSRPIAKTERDRGMWAPAHPLERERRRG